MCRQVERAHQELSGLFAEVLVLGLRGRARKSEKLIKHFIQEAGMAREADLFTEARTHVRCLRAVDIPVFASRTH
jgi:hypothetical protein